MTNSVSKEYSSVLFDLKLDYQYVVNELELLINVLKDKEIEKFFKSPIISANEKKRIIKEALKLDDGEFLYFLYVLVDNKRIDMIDNIYVDYCDLIDQKLNVGRFTVYTPTLLDENIKNNIKIMLEKKYNKNVILDVIIDENLIGGIVIKYKNNVIDDSISFRLLDLENQLLNK